MKNGFSLIEILISLLVLSGSIATMFSGFDTSSQLDLYSAFESEAAFIAEREVELIKSDLLEGKREPGPSSCESRFKHKPGWEIHTVWTSPDETDTLRILCTIKQADRSFKIESFLYLPKEKAKG